MFKAFFSKYCRQQINEGRCGEDCCEFCPVNNAYEKIFCESADCEDDPDD